ncbi:MAG: lysine biosynthesis protein LysX [Candidatus Marinimicrobia bacterium]|nr:lysine biosynthesis protein LysX [Candidatus Neomarinimicrobiota bacterium]MCF7830015.1 lysine biosynthesis protein LysX [Candidatus Neomarinimicrobiota bacterium]MCF7881943.1 lysine biosynthesis protein LysX [Candidatus Neomarinimicrobiota bacterium]
MHVGVLIGRVRVEEKLLFKALEERGVNYEPIYDDELQFGSANIDEWSRFDVILERSISHSRALTSLGFFNKLGIPTVNEYEVARICGDKIETSVLLEEADIPQPEFMVAYTPDSALEAIETMGYPVVLKPAIGSWGRLQAKITSRNMAESILEHKKTLGGVQHAIFYIQEYIEKPGRDLRTFVIDGEPICAIRRESDHWITNTSRGGHADNHPMSDELIELSRNTSDAIGGGVIAVDVFESDRGLLVNEVNYTMEFRNSIEPTGVDIPARIIDYVIAVGEGATAAEQEEAELEAVC